MAVIAPPPALLAHPLPAVEVRLGDATGLDPLRCAEVTMELKRWLWLANRLRVDLAAGEATLDSLPILWCQGVLDEAWHAFILHTGAYAAFCDEHLGGFLHHEPNLHDGGRLPGDDHDDRAAGDAPPPAPDHVRALLHHVHERLGPTTVWNWYVRDGLWVHGVDTGALRRDSPVLVDALVPLLV